MNTKEMIIKVAREEFILNGYQKASLRNIASKCNITATALYRHFKDKEDIFQSVIKPFINGIEEMISYIEEKDYDLLENNNVSEVWSFEGDNNFHFLLIFKGDKELLKLIIRERRDWLRNYLSEYEVNATLEYLSKMRELGLNVNKFNERAFKTIIDSYIDAYFNVLLMNLDDDESFKICKTISKFYTVGFRNLLGF